MNREEEAKEALLEVHDQLKEVYEPDLPTVGCRDRSLGHKQREFAASHSGVPRGAVADSVEKQERP